MQVTDADLQPYRALAASVIWQGVADAVLAEKSKRADPACGWLFDESDVPRTFRWWCEVAGLDADNILEQVELRWRAFAWQLGNGFDFSEACDEANRREASAGEVE